MRKRDELIHGCMAKARDDEMCFVLLGRDAAAPVAIQAWIAERIRIGKNAPGDAKIVEAEECAITMSAERLAAGGYPFPAAPPDAGQGGEACRAVLADFVARAEALNTTTDALPWPIVSPSLIAAGRAALSGIATPLPDADLARLRAENAKLRALCGEAFDTMAECTAGDETPTMTRLRVAAAGRDGEDRDHA